eukprot:1161608-Pelagomonas_calceolata.AAC.6
MGQSSSTSVTKASRNEGGPTSYANPESMDCTGSATNCRGQSYDQDKNQKPCIFWPDYMITE